MDQGFFLMLLITSRNGTFNMKILECTLFNLAADARYLLSKGYTIVNCQFVSNDKFLIFYY